MRFARIMRQKRRFPTKHPTGVRHVHLIDTSIASDNIGDEIIVEAARHHLIPHLKDTYITTSSGHDGLGPFGRDLAAQADVAILLGTNALSPVTHRRRYIWHVPPEDAEVLEGKVVLMGVGANRAFEAIEPAQSKFLERLLSENHQHSVRDTLAGQIVEASGRQALNTSCPTLWQWQAQPPKVPQRQADTVIFTLTKHRPDPKDTTFVEILRDQYKRVVFFPQQPRDLGYLREIARTDGIETLSPNLLSYDRFLSETDTDVIGTRLHGSIRGLRHGRRVLAIAIDNRAASIGAETGLPIVERAHLAEALPQWITEQAGAPLRTVPGEAIDAWLAQF